MDSNAKRDVLMIACQEMVQAWRADPGNGGWSEAVVYLERIADVLPPDYCRGTGLEPVPDSKDGLGFGECPSCAARIGLRGPYMNLGLRAHQDKRRKLIDSLEESHA